MTAEISCLDESIPGTIGVSYRAWNTCAALKPLTTAEQGMLW